MIPSPLLTMTLSTHTNITGESIVENPESFLVQQEEWRRYARQKGCIIAKTVTTNNMQPELVSVCVSGFPFQLLSLLV